MATFIFNNKTSTLTESKTISEILISNDIDPKYVMIRVDGTIIPKERFDSFIVPSDSEVKAYPFVGGG